MPARRSQRRARVYAVVLAGGYGTRFWPQSRRRRPKQFLTVVGRRSMLQETVARLRGAVPLAGLVVVAAREFVAQIRRQLPQLPRGHLLVEPVARGTAAAIALAAEWIARSDPDAVMAVFPSDHVITDVARFRRALTRALALAAARPCLVTFGVPPSSADTGYGYVEIGPAIDTDAPRGCSVLRFHEKPSAETADRYLSAGGFLWNSGMFVWQVGVIRAALTAYAPKIASAVAALVAARTPPHRKHAAAAYGRLPVTSVDVAVLEKAADVAVVEADFGWSDVGSWATVAPLWGSDGAGNAVRGPAVLIDTRNVLVLAAERMVAVVGLRDVVIVDSPDAVLVCHKNRAQDVRRVVDELRRRRRVDLI